MTIINQNLITTLKLAGLNETEAEIYLACLELGPVSVWNIYKKTGIKRPTCYAVLDNLLVDKIASKTDDGSRAIFSVIEPIKLLRVMENRKDQFHQVLPLFDALKNKSQEKPQIRVYEGIEGINQACMLGVDQPEDGEILILASAEIWTRYSQNNKIYLAQRVTKNIGQRVLFTNTKENQTFLKMDREELRETRFLPQDYFSPKVETQVFADTVVYITVSGKEPFATVIENEAIAADERQKFEILWKVSH